MTGPMSEMGKVWPVPTSAPPRDVVSLDPGRVARALKRQWFVITLGALVGAALAIAAAIGSIPRYEATVTILLDEERSELLQQVSALPNAVNSDAAIQSEMQIISSRALALAVVDALGLDKDAHFLNPPTPGTAKVLNAVRGLAQPLMDLMSGPPALAPDAPVDEADPAQTAREMAASLLLERILVQRVERSFVMLVTYSDFDPHRAAKIARTYGQAYMDFQLASTNEVAMNAGSWIAERLDLMERRNIEAASAVQRFRFEHNLQQVRGDLLTEQQQSEVASALVQAATETATLRAQLESYEALLSATPAEMAAVAGLQRDDDNASPLVQLRAEYANTRRSLSSVVARGGENHPQAAGLRAAMAVLEREIAVELEGTVAAVRARHNIAQSREASLRSELAAMTDTKGGNDTVMGRLAQLEAIAQTYATVYADYLLRFETTAQQQGFPIASVQIISDAEVPRDPASPRKLRMLAAGLVLGALAGLMLAAVREMRARPLSTARDVTAQCGLPCVGLAAPYSVQRRNDRARMVTMRTADRIRQELDRKTPMAGGMIVGLAPADRGSDVAGVVVALCRALVARAGRALLVDGGGLPKGVAAALSDLENVEILSIGDLRAALCGRDAREPGSPALAGLRDAWPYTLIVLPPLTESTSADHMGWLDATVLTIGWGKLSAGFVSDAMRDHRDFRVNLVTTVLDGADLRRARRLMDPDEYEARLIHA
ncbi:MAG: GumC family protein [Gemmobacter sp.]|nr:GumC family protein [Gemmobacter sp.]